MNLERKMKSHTMKKSMNNRIPVDEEVLGENNTADDADSWGETVIRELWNKQAVCDVWYIYIYIARTQQYESKGYPP